MMNFAAIDFETATARRSSACSVAVVEVADGKIVDTYYQLIRPPKMEFNSFNIQIHGIRPADVRNQPDFSGIWPELKMRLENRIVVAHNAQFDMSVLKGALLEYNLPVPVFNHCCTVSMARRAWPELENHKLDTVGRHLHIDFKHHDALEDAKTCAAIPLLAGQKFKADNFAELVRELGVEVKPFRC